MRFRKLCRNGPKLSVLGLGTWPIGGGMGRVDEKTAIATIRTAIDNGISTIDTAQYYRTSEELIGKALKGGYRSRCFLATKASFDFSRKGIISAIHNSLRALKVDCVDLYQIHNWDPAYQIEESMETMARLKEQGKTLFIGVSNFNIKQMQHALRTARFESNQLRYNLFDRGIEYKDMRFCEIEQIGILAHSPLAKGLLTGKYTKDYKFSRDDERSEFPRFQGENFAKYLNVAKQLKVMANEKGLSLIQLSRAWILRKSAISCVLVGAKNPRQLEEHLGSIGVSFTNDELEHIDIILAHAPDVSHS